MARIPTTIALTESDERRAIRRTGYAPRTIGVPLLPPLATDEQWLDARRLRVSASEMAAVVGIPSAYDSPFSMWWRKQPEFPNHQTMPMYVGSKLEAVIGELWADEHPDAAMYRPGARLWVAPAPNEFLAATPDFLVVFDADPSNVEPLECKSDEGGDWGKAGTDEIPDHHLVQVWQQCFVLGAKRGHVMRLAHKRPQSYVIPFGDDQRSVFMSYVATAREFLARLESGVPPDIDGHAATTRVLIETSPAIDAGEETYIDPHLLTAFIDEGVRLQASKARYAELRNRVRSAMGSAQYGLDKDGRRAVRRSVYKVPAAMRRAYTVDSINRRADYGKDTGEGPEAGR